MKSRLMAKLAAVVGSSLLLSTVVAMPAAAAHYQGGDYGLCIYPQDTTYDGVWVQGYGLGSDVPYKNATIVAWGKVAASSKCVRSGATRHVSRAQIDKIALRRNNINYKELGPFNNGSSSISAISGNAAPPCGQYYQSALRFSVRYTNGALLTGYLNSGGFKRC